MIELGNVGQLFMGGLKGFIKMTFSAIAAKKFWGVLDDPYKFDAPSNRTMTLDILRCEGIHQDILQQGRAPGLLQVSLQ